MAVSGAACDRLEFTIGLLPGRRQSQAFKARNILRIALLSRQLLPGGIGHSLSFRQIS